MALVLPEAQAHGTRQLFEVAAPGLRLGLLQGFGLELEAAGLFCRVSGEQVRLIGLLDELQRALLFGEVALAGLLPFEPVLKHLLLQRSLELFAVVGLVLAEREAGDCACFAEVSVCELFAARAVRLRLLRELAAVGLFSLAVQLLRVRRALQRSLQLLQAFEVFFSLVQLREGRVPARWL